MAPNQTPANTATFARDITGKTLGNYVLIRRLGRGGMANVYLAHQTTLNRPVAVKVLKSELATDKAYVARFHREAQAAAALTQPNIVQIYEVGEIDGVHFIAQEYVRGQNLRQYLNRNTVVEPILAVSIMRQVAAALQKASEHSVIHRDIKPENIMLASNGEVKVTDFGLARVLDDKRTDLTQIGITMGTPLYMSPEQAEGRHVDTRSDLYSLGITAWHMFAGRPPFEGENALTIAVKHVKEDLVSLSQIRPDLPDDLCEIVKKLANKNPDERFQTPVQLIKQLRTLEFEDIADWDQLSEKLAVDDPAAGIGEPTIPQSRLEVTRQLETIMSGQFRSWWQSPVLLGAVSLMFLLGVLSGVVFAYRTPPDDPLATVQQRVSGEIPVKDTAKDQYFYAYLIASSPATTHEQEEKLWKAVRAYHPLYDNLGNENQMTQLYYRKTDIRLGEFYLEAGEFDKALVLFERLADLEETEGEFRLAGLVGAAIVYDGWKIEEELQYVLPILQEGTEKLKSQYLKQRIEELLERRFPGQIRQTDL